MNTFETPSDMVRVEKVDLAKGFEDHVQEYTRIKTALEYAKKELKKHHDNLALEFIRRIETGETKGS